MRFETTALIKGTTENVSQKDGKHYKSVLLFGTEGNPADIKAGCTDDQVYAKSKKYLHQMVRVMLDLRVYNGLYFFDVLALEPLPVANK